MKKFKELSLDEQHSVMHEQCAGLLKKFISTDPDEFKSIIPSILEDLSSLMHNKHPNADFCYTEDARSRVSRRVSYRIYNHLKDVLTHDNNSSFSETHYSTPFDVSAYISKLKAEPISEYIHLQ